MSSVRMCDRCALIFSENEEGWTTFGGSRKIKGQWKDVTQDACPGCSNSMFGETTSPRIQLPPPSRIELEYAERHTGGVVTDSDNVE